MQFLRHFCVAGIVLLLTACTIQNSEIETPPELPVAVNMAQLLDDLQYLSSDDLGGRLVGSRGNRLAAEFIEGRFELLGLQSFGNSYRHTFDHINESNSELVEAINLVGFVEGRVNPDQYLVLTAHYDHLGTLNGEIYNGADDNASGTSALLAAATWFSNNPPDNSIIFIAFDAEEQGLAGARHFINNPPVPVSAIKLNVNMDMISTNDESEIFASGTSHYPFLRPMVEQSVADDPIIVYFGHDNPFVPSQDWTMASDHGPFHEKGIPFIYFGVEDHSHYHQPTDTFDTINQEFFYRAVLAITGFVQDMDGQIDEVIAASGR